MYLPYPTRGSASPGGGERSHHEQRYSETGAGIIYGCFHNYRCTRDRGLAVLYDLESSCKATKKPIDCISSGIGWVRLFIKLLLLYLMGKPGKKSQRNHGELYAETKTCQVMLTMTPTGKRCLDQLAARLLLSRSELIEQWARGLLDLHQVTAQLNEINTQ